MDLLVVGWQILLKTVIFLLKTIGSWQILLKIW